MNNVNINKNGFLHQIWLDKGHHVLEVLPFILGCYFSIGVEDWLVSFIINSIFFACIITNIDALYLKHHGFNINSKLALYILPLYLLKRSEVLNQEKQNIWGNVASIFFLACIMGFISYTLHENDVNKVSCEVVTDILQKKLKLSTSCKKASLTEEIEGFHTGTALLSNGNRISISAEQLEGGKVHVQITEPLFNFQ